MAKEKSAKKESSIPQPPEGFQDARRPRASAFWAPEKGAVIQGDILGRYARKGFGGRAVHYYVIKTSAPCMGKVDVTPEGHEGERQYDIQTIPAGQLVSVDESADLRLQLQERIDSGEHYATWIRCEGKEIIDTGNPMWRFSVYLKIAAAGEVTF